MAPSDRRQELSDIFDQADYGFITSDEFLTQSADLLQMNRSDLAELLEQHYVRDHRMVALVQRLRDRGYKTALLSNVNDSLIKELFTQQEQDALFDAVVLSSSLGMIKPSRAIYEYTLQQLDVVPHDAIMIDDLAVNIHAAHEIGMAGVVYEEYEQLAAALREVEVDA